MIKRLTLAALPLTLLVGCSSSDGGSAPTQAAASSTMTSSSPASSTSSEASATNSATSTSTTASTTSRPGATPSTTKPGSATSKAHTSAIAPSPSTPHPTATSRRATPTAAKTADCTNLGTGEHYACAQQEYDAINEADEASGPSDGALPTASACGDWDRAVKPGFMLIMCGDGGEGLTNITWSSWTAESASGTATHFQRVCEPSCAEGREVTVPVRVRLSAPVSTSSGPEFSTMTVTGQQVHTVHLVTGK